MVERIKMNILFFDMGSYTYRDILTAFKKMGHNCRTVYYHFPDRYEDAFFEERLKEYLQKDFYDCVFSVNFFPLVAKVCDRCKVMYLSWSYDSPLDERLQDYFHYETNCIFLFDYLEAEEYQKKGYQNVFHLPLAVDTDRLDAMVYQQSIQEKYCSQLSFVGKMYDSPLDELLHPADDYCKGFIHGILQTQMQVYGYYFVEDLITETLLAEINRSYKKLGQKEVLLTKRGLSHAVAARITQIERTALLERANQRFDVRLYTYRGATLPEGLPLNYGPLKYYEEMPLVFRGSKLNLNITLKDIRSGIPLRALDIMGSRGALLSNYQPELAEQFEDGKDVILYDSLDDAMDKAEFYLRKEDLRERIALNGYQKVKEHFSYEKQLGKMFEISFGD